MDMILVERRFQTGDKLPNELQLAQELGVKPNTLASRVSRIKAKFRKNFPESEKFLQDGCKESRPPGHKEGRGGSEP